MTATTAFFHFAKKIHNRRRILENSRIVAVGDVCAHHYIRRYDINYLSVVCSDYDDNMSVVCSDYLSSQINWVLNPTTL